jgi:hypothetical protein
METSARSLVDHWSWAADKGLMNRNTASGLRSACARVFETLGDGWEQTDIQSLDVEDMLLRFQNLKKKSFRPQVLEVYKQRFRKAVLSYLDYLANPGGWRPGTQDRASNATRSERPQKRQPTTATVSVAANHTAGPDEVEYPFPLRSGVMARLILPRQLTRDDVNRLSTFMSMLIVNGDKAQSVEEDSRERRDS